MSHPLPAGTRVHHRGCQWNRWFDEAERQETPSWGWGTVIDVQRRNDKTPKRYSDGSYEYEIAYDAPHMPGSPETGWWASYHIDHHEIPAVASPSSLVPKEDPDA